MRPSEALALHRDAVVACLREHGVSEAFLFGSGARGEDRAETSDLDIAVRFTQRPRSALDYYGALGDLEERIASITGVRVDVEDADAPGAEKLLRDARRLF